MQRTGNGGGGGSVASGDAMGFNGQAGPHHGQTGHGGSSAAQVSVNRLAELSMNSQSGFGHLAVAGGGQLGHREMHDPSLMERNGSMVHLQGANRHAKMMGGQQFVKNPGLLGMQDTDYAEQLLSELAWAQGSTNMNGHNMGMASPPIDSVTNMPSARGGNAHAPPHPSYDFAGLKRDHVAAHQRFSLHAQQQFAAGMHGMAQDPMSMMGSVGSKRNRDMMGEHGGLDQRALAAGHVSQGGAHQDALMELARENLLLKHQLQVASLELSRLRQTCDKYQHDVGDDGDKLNPNQSRYCDGQHAIANPYSPHPTCYFLHCNPRY